MTLPPELRQLIGSSCVYESFPQWLIRPNLSLVSNPIPSEAALPKGVTGIHKCIL